MEKDEDLAKKYYDEGLKDFDLSLPYERLTEETKRYIKSGLGFSSYRFRFYFNELCNEVLKSLGIK